MYMNSDTEINVVKRDGSSEILNLEKMHKMTEEACAGLSGVSASQVEMSSGIQFYDGISTSDIQQILVKSAADLINIDEYNYQYVAARLLLYGLRKEVMKQFDYIPLIDIIKKNIKLKVYDPAILENYSVKELEKIDSFIKHKRDLDFTYAGLRQVVDKYLVQNRTTDEIYETPQYMYIMIAATMFSNYPKETRLNYVKKYYDAISSFKINIPTPVMAGVRTPIRQYASCVLIDVDDTLPSIFSSNSAIGYYTAQRAGIGVNYGRIRGIGDQIRHGEVEHTGVIPFAKTVEATVRSCTQNGVRGGSATMHFPIWHTEIEDILVLKNNKGSEDNRVRRLDYSIQISKLFYERLIKNEDISLFSPNDVPGLYEAFGTPDFDDLYTKYERSHKTKKRKIKAQKLFGSLLKERAETGRIYIMNIDHCNSHSSFLDRVYMSNLCVAPETTVLTKFGYVPIAELNEETLDIWNGEDWSSVTIKKTGSNQQLLKVEIDKYTTIECTPYHKFFTINSYQNWARKKYTLKRAFELKPGDKLIKFNLPVIEGTEILDKAYAIGLHTGDGSYHGSNPIIDLYKHKKEILDSLPIKEYYVYEEKTRVFLDIPKNTKFMVPNNNYNIESRLKWLAGYIDADGHIATNGSNQSIQITCINLEFLKELKLMLQTLGVNAKVTLRDEKQLQKIKGIEYECSAAYRLLIQSTDTYHLYNLGLFNYSLNKTYVPRQPTRDARKFSTITNIIDENRFDDTYCFTESKRGMGMFNGVLTGNCQEITLPTTPIQHIDDTKGEIALCILSAINIGKINKLGELEELTDLVVRALDELIDFQEYPVKAAEISTRARRSLGVGYIGLAHYLAKNKVKYDDPEAWELVNKTTEAFQYYLLKASVAVAKEKGPCDYFHRTKYSKGILPIDTYKKDIDAFISSDLAYDWEELRMEILEHGLRNSTLSAQMPSESSSVVCNATNGVEPPRGYLSVKKSKKGPLKQIVPGYYHLRNYYTLLWDMKSNDGYIKVLASMQKYFDQAISGNWSYNPENYPDNEVPLSEMMSDLLKTYKLGWKTSYYQNTYDSKSDGDDIDLPELEVIDFDDAENCEACEI